MSPLRQYDRHYRRDHRPRSAIPIRTAIRARSYRLQESYLFDAHDRQRRSLHRRDQPFLLTSGSSTEAFGSTILKRDQVGRPGPSEQTPAPEVEENLVELARRYRLQAHTDRQHLCSYCDIGNAYRQRAGFTGASSPPPHNGLTRGSTPPLSIPKRRPLHRVRHQVGTLRPEIAGHGRHLPDRQG